MKSQILREHEVRALVETGECEIVRDVKPQPPTIDEVRELSGATYHLSNGYHAPPGIWRVIGPVWAVRKLMLEKGHKNHTFKYSCYKSGPVLWRCPLGTVGEQRYCRETYAIESDYCDGGPYPPPYDDRPIKKIVDGAFWEMAHYKATDPTPHLSYDSYDACQSGGCVKNDHCCHWKSPVTMPAWASRLTIEITAVSVEQREGVWRWVAKAKRVESEK
jgi:hypothetical protein